MDSKKLYFGLIGLLVILGAGLVLSLQEANNLLGTQSKNLVGLKATDKATQAQQKQLVQDKKDIAAYQDLNTIAKTVVPQDKDQARAVREIVNLANQSGIGKLSSIGFPPSTLGGTGTTQVKTSAGLTQVAPVKGIAGVYNLQITVTQAATDPVPYNSFIMFLSKLEQNRRTAQVGGITVQPDTKSPNMVSFTLVINEFIKPTP